MKVQTINTDKGERYILIDNNYKVVQQVKDFLKFLDNIKKAPNTLKTYAYNLKIFYDFLNETNLTIEDVIKKDETHKGPLQTLSDFIVWMQYPNRYKGVILLEGETQQRSNKTINQIMSTVLEFYDYLAKNGDIEKIDVYKELRINPQFKNFIYEMKAKKMIQNSSLLKLKEKKKSLKFITREQYNELYKATNNHRDKIIAALMFEAGLRMSEVLGMHIQDLALWGNKINIVYRDDNSNGASVKNCSEGVVFIPNYVVELIQDYLIEDLVDYDTDFLIINFYGENKGQPMTKSAIEQQYLALSTKIGYKVNPHMLRHGFATEKLANGYALIDVQNALRHKNIQSTTIYTSITDEMKKEKIRQFYDEISVDFGFDESMEKLTKGPDNK